MLGTSDTGQWQDPQGNEGITEYESWAVEYPPIDQDHIFESMLICTKKRKRTDSEPLYQEDGVTFQDHLKLFAVELLTLSAGEARHKRWEVFKHSNGRKTYRIAICTRIFVSDGGWALKRLMKRYDDIPDETGKLRYIF